MTTPSDAILSVIQTARGNRPYSIENHEIEQTFNVALALTVELLSTNDRVDRLERHISRITGKPLHDVRLDHSDDDAEKMRSVANEASITRILRILIDPRPKVDQRPTSRHRDAE
ncbi:MAG: hypothetical protein ACOH1V_05335 [Stenotrophomonas sp.]